MATIFVVTIAVSGGGEQLQSRQFELTEALRCRLTEAAAAMISARGDSFLVSREEVEVRTARYMSGGAAPRLGIDLRFHEEAVLTLPEMLYDAHRASMGFVWSVVQVLYEDIIDLTVMAGVSRARVTAWLPRAIGVEVNLENGYFPKTWGGVLHAGSGIVRGQPRLWRT